ncbi:hypothetical protein F5883DRAFT_666165 [Diaporthe sp. PMI_573]|nr:hypothetical protein F5883DRAFT_666165 [Diaporthaceae sp. PMI_573]
MSQKNVFPLRYFDDTPLWRAFILYYMFVPDSVLDPEKLKSSLQLLASREGWKKFGAHTDEKYKVISYSHVVYATTAADHLTACYIPELATDRLSVLADLDIFKDLFRPDGAPTNLDDYLNSKIPQMGLHVVSFLDKTLVTVYFPHTLMDGMSMAPFLDAWILAFQGRASEIQCPTAPEGEEISDDPLHGLSMKPTAKHVLADHQMLIAGLAGWVLRNVNSFFTNLENRMVCVPASMMAKLHEEANLDSAADRTGDEPPPFLSDGDMLCAWWTKLLLATAGVPQNSNETVVLNSAYSLRKVLFDSNVGTGDAENSKMAPGSNNIFVSNLTAFFNNMDLITFSNWTRAKLFDFDFSTAAVGTKIGRPVRPIYVQNNQFGLKFPNAFSIMGKDGSGNYWFSGYLRKGHWGRVEAELGIHGSPS